MAVALLPATVVAADEGVPTVGASNVVIGASGECGTNLTWKLTDDGTLTISGTGDMKNYDYSENLHPWSSDAVKKLVIDSEVTSIGEGAFTGCSSLTSATMPERVTEMGDYVFAGCTSLTSITIPDGVTEIYRMFEGCTSLTTIIIPDGVTKIHAMFEDCTNLKSITLPDSLQYISEWTFKNCTSLESITLPAGLQAIRREAFYSCTSLESITIPDSVTSIGDLAFADCSSLESIEISDGVTEIGCRTFNKCTSLKSITLPDNLQVIDSFAFVNCTSLESITIPDSVTSIGYGAFGNCRSLASITIPNSVTSIGYGAFDQCTSLANISVPCSITNDTLENAGVTVSDTGDTYTRPTNGTLTKSHTKDNGTTVKQPTETETGVKEYRCTVCKVLLATETIPVVKPTEPEKPTTPAKPVEVKPSEEEKRQQVITETRNEIETTPKGGSVTINADDDENGVHWSIMDAARENGVGLKIEWNGKTITIPAGKALNEKYRTYYPYEYLAKYDFKNNKPAEIPAIPETGVPINLIITLALIAFATTATAIVLKKKVK